jgi:integrase
MVDISTKQSNLTAAKRVEAAWVTGLAKEGDTLEALLSLRDEHTRSRKAGQRVNPERHSLAFHEHQRQANEEVFLFTFEEKFFKYLDTNVPSPRTRQFYKDAWKPLRESPLGGQMLRKITPALIQQWVQERRAKVGPASVNGSLRTLRRALKLAEEWGVIKKCPKIKMLPGEHQREFVISEELLGDMLKHEKCTPDLKLMLPFLIDTGLRISEALGLTWETVGLEPKPGASLGWVYVAKGKSKYSKRYVPLTERAHGLLKNLKASSTSKWVFAGEGEEATSRHWISEQFRTLRDAMKLPDDCVVHSCRHTFCTRLGEAGAEAFVIQKLAGHSSVVISQRYTHPSPERLEVAVAKMGAAFQAAE